MRILSDAKTSRPSVAHLGPDPAGGGGMAAVLRSLLASPLAERYSMTMIVTYRGPRALSRVITFSRSLLQLALWSLRSGAPRLAHVHSAARGSLYRKALVIAVARLLRIPVLVQIHAGSRDIETFDDRLGRARRWAIGRGLRWATRVLAVSRETARAMESRFGLSGIAIVPNAAPPLPDDAVPLDPGGEADRRVLYLGGFANPVKGGSEILATVAALAGRMPDASFALAGPGEPPPQLSALVEETDNVRWLGWLDPTAKQAEMSRSAIFVLPSSSEGLPVALLEAMSWGRAIVATAVGGVPDAVENGRDAILVPPGDRTALAEAIRFLLGDPEIRHSLGAAARQRAAKLTDRDVCQRLDDLYQEVLR